MFKKYLSSLVSQYYTHTLGKVENTVSYLNRFTLFNKSSGEFYHMSYDYLNKRMNDAIYYNAVSTFMSNSYNSLDFVPIFVTFTLPTEYHKFKQVTDKITSRKKFVSNPMYKNYTINEGYQVLSNAFRDLTHEFYISRRRINVKYFRVVEPHKDFTPHLHALLYVPSYYFDEFEIHFKNILNSNDLGVQFDYTVLDSALSATSYIMKYVKKSLSPSSSGDLFVIDGWASSNKIRMVSYSRTPVPRYVFDKFSRNIDLSFGMEKYSMINNVLDFCSFDIVYTKSNKIVRSCSSSALKSELHFAYFEIVVRQKKQFLKPFILKKDAINRDYVLDYLEQLKKDNFNFFKLHFYEYDEFYSFKIHTDLAYLSDDFDFFGYYKRMIFNDFYEFIELYNNFISNYFVIDVSYRLERSAVFTCHFDCDDFDMVYTCDNIVVSSSV